MTKLTTLSVQRAKLCLLDNKPLREDGANSRKEALKIIETHGKRYSLKRV